MGLCRTVSKIKHKANLTSDSDSDPNEPLECRKKKAHRNSKQQKPDTLVICKKKNSNHKTCTKRSPATQCKRRQPQKQASLPGSKGSEEDEVTSTSDSVNSSSSDEEDTEDEARTSRHSKHQVFLVIEGKEEDHSSDDISDTSSCTGTSSSEDDSSSSSRLQKNGRGDVEKEEEGQKEQSIIDAPGISSAGNSAGHIACLGTDGTGAKKQTQGLPGDSSNKTDTVSSQTLPSATQAKKNDKATATHWSMSEDGLLRGMKGENVEWEEIARLLHRDIYECQMRWAAIESEVTPKGSHGIDVNNSGMLVQHPGRILSSQATNPIEHRTQQEYMQRHIYPALHRAVIRPVADTYLTTQDCATLAAVHGRVQRLNLLEVQAGFYNATGRMMPLVYLKHKIDTAERKTG